MNPKARYKQVVETVRQNTGGKQPPLISESGIRVTACSTASLDVDHYETALKAAVQNDDILRYHGQLAVAEPEPLQAVIEAEVAADSPRKALIGRCNQLLDEVDGG
jgi:hypothetical protein